MTSVDLRVLRVAVLVVRIAAVEVLVADERAVRQDELLIDVHVARTRCRCPGTGRSGSRRPRWPGSDGGRRSPPDRPIVARSAATMTAGSARPMNDPTKTATAKMKMARARQQPASGAVAVERSSRCRASGCSPRTCRSVATPGREGEDHQDDEDRQQPGEVPAPARRRQPPGQPDRAALELAGDDRHAEEQADRVGDEQERRRDEGAERPRVCRACETPPGS